MWCSHCGLDDRGLPPADGAPGKLCGQCGRRLLAATDGAGQTIEEPRPGAPGAPRVDWDEWDFDFALDLRAEPAGPSCNAGAASDSDPATASPRHAAPELPPLASRQRRARQASPVASGVLSVGIAVLVCGTTLMIGSFTGERTHLWSVGAPLALGGQSLILIGLIVQMDLLCQGNRDNSQALSGIDRQIADLRITTSLLCDASPAGTAAHQQPAGPHLPAGPPRGGQEAESSLQSRRSSSSTSGRSTRSSARE
jgi:hypothetical protein